MYKARFAATLIVSLCLVLSQACLALTEGGAVTADGRAAVATVNPLATQAALDAYAQGGNAIDAALAAAFTLGVVDGHNSGIGGGLFALVRFADGHIEALDGREMAPQAATRDMYLRDGKADPALSQTGPLAVGVPGSVAVFDYLAAHGSRLGLRAAIEPAADLAEQGFAIDKIYAGRIANHVEVIRQFEGSAGVLLDSSGRPWPAGHKLVQAELAKTYRGIARDGARYFYEGKFAAQLADWMQSHGGIITRDDMRDYRMLKREPLETYITTPAGTYTFFGFPPPSSGGVHVAQILQILSHFDLAGMPELQRYHLLGEAMKLAFADRAFWLGDPDFAPVPRGLVDPGYTDKLAGLIDLTKASPVAGAHTPPRAEIDLFGKHTTHIATADKDGNWVAITTTVNTDFGSKVIVPGTGVVLNNQMDDFSAQPGAPNAYGLVGTEANSIQPGKRPLSSMSPTLVLQEGQPVMTVGAAGGPTIITQVVQALVNSLYLQKPLYESLYTPRVHQQWKPDYLFVETRLDPTLKAGLEAMGHTLQTMGPYGSTQAITLDSKGRFSAVAEPRLKERNQ